MKREGSRFLCVRLADYPYTNAGEGQKKKKEKVKSTCDFISRFENILLRESIDAEDIIISNDRASIHGDISLCRSLGFWHYSSSIHACCEQGTVRNRPAHSMAGREIVERNRFSWRTIFLSKSEESL